MIVKVCGVTSIEDAEACVDAGVDWIGLNFVPASPRFVAIEAARNIADAIRGRARVVGVVADLERGAMEALIERVGLDVLQLHGDEPPELVEALGDKAYKALRIADERDAERVASYSGMTLLDARVEGALGGTGKTIDANVAARIAARRDVILAGGLTPENVAGAIASVRPYGVDTASGVEIAPGKKDIAKVRAFVARAKES